MSSIKPQTLKGFRDFLPNEARKRQYVINLLRQVFESYGFEPLETPTLEYEEILIGKYGEEGDKLMYRFVDRGGRKVALRYDQTVPLARVVAQYGSTGSPQSLPMPFKRYQIQNVWRADNTQKGRYREFLQCDADIVGSNSPLSDAETISVVDAALKKLGFEKYKIRFNSRDLLFAKIKQAKIPDNLAMSAIRVIDKIKKIGWVNVQNELIKNGIGSESAGWLKDLLAVTQPIEGKNMNDIWLISSQMGIKNLKWDLTLARGLDYYTGLIFEVDIDEYSAGSVCGGGRYDNLIGMFSGRQIPAVGFAFGFDRLMEAMDELNLFPQNITASLTKVLVTIFNPELLDKSLETTLLLYRNKVTAELYLDENASLEKQLKYADKKGIPYAVIIGEDEAKSNKLSLKNLTTRTQETISVKEAINKLKQL